MPTGDSACSAASAPRAKTVRDDREAAGRPSWRGVHTRPPQDRVWTGMHEGAQALRAAARERGHVALHALSPSGSAHPFTLSAEPQDATKPPVHPRVTASHTAACAAPQKYSPVATPCAVRRARWPCRLQPRETRPDHDADAADSLESPMRVFPRTAFVAEWRFSRLEWPAGHKN